MLQWGRNFFVTEIIGKAIKLAKVSIASMGP